MSKAAAEKIIVTVEQEPLLLDLDFPELLKAYRKVNEKYAFHNAKTELYDAQRRQIKNSIGIAIDAVKADVVVYTDSKGLEWKSTRISPDPKEVLDPSMLRTNIMKFGKLAAPIVQKIMDASMIKQPITPYVRVIIPDEAK